MHFGNWSSRRSPYDACVELHPAATMLAGAEFLRGVIAAFPYRRRPCRPITAFPSPISPATARVPQRNTACMPSTASAASTTFLI